MRNLFNYDNPVMQALMMVGDMIIVNVLFLVCCIPIVTIGAAQAGLYNAMRVLQDKEDDSSVAAAFFRGLRTGFGRITVIWCGFMVAFYLLFLSCSATIIYDRGNWDAPVIFAVIGLCLCGLYQTAVTAFHSRFDCSIKQLLRNAILLILAHPLSCLLATVVTWVWVAIFLYDAYLFMQLTPLFITVWFSATFLFAYTFLKKPFESIVQIHNQQQPAEKTEETDDDSVLALDEGNEAEEALVSEN